MFVGKKWFFSHINSSNKKKLTWNDITKTCTWLFNEKNVAWMITAHTVVQSNLCSTTGHEWWWWKIWTRHWWFNTCWWWSIFILFLIFGPGTNFSYQKNLNTKQHDESSFLHSLNLYQPFVKLEEINFFFKLNVAVITTDDDELSLVVIVMGIILNSIGWWWCCCCCKTMMITNKKKSRAR